MKVIKNGLNNTQLIQEKAKGETKNREKNKEKNLKQIPQWYDLIIPILY